MASWKLDNEDGFVLGKGEQFGQPPTFTPGHTMVGMNISTASQSTGICGIQYGGSGYTKLKGGLTDQEIPY